MKRSIVMFVVSALLVIGAFGCKAKQEAAAPAAQPAAAQMAAPAEAAIAGKVVETMNSGGYTYLSVENAGKKTWVAIPQAAVKVGQEVTCQPGMVMNNFTSKTLNRTFDSIIFSGGIAK